MITAIITQIKTGTYKNVYARYDGVKNPTAPYVMIWGEAAIIQGTGQSLGGVRVALHVAPGNIDSLITYMTGDIVTLLHKVRLTDDKGNYFRLEDTGEMSPIVSNNDDGTISIDRLFTLPLLWKR